MDDCYWFDVYNVEHLAAYKELSETGVWPKGFITDDIKLPHMWITKIQLKMATAWVESKL